MEKKHPRVNDYPEIHQHFELVESIHEPVVLSAGTIPKTNNVNGALADQWTLPDGDETIPLIFDFNGEIAGKLSFRVSASAATKLRVKHGECLDEVLSDKPTATGFYYPPEDVIDVEPGETPFTSPARRGFRYVRLVNEGSADVNISTPRALQLNYPLSERSTFVCSDETLNAIWRLCSDTTACCMRQFYEDGVKRDGLLWIGDYRVQYLCNVGAFGDAALARKCLFMIAASQRDDGALPACAARGGGHQHPHGIDYMPGIPSPPEKPAWILLNYCADYVSAIGEYILHSGDAAILPELWPCLKGVIHFLMKSNLDRAEPLTSFITDNGTQNSPNGYHCRTCLRLSVAWAMRAAVELASQMNDTETAAACRSHHQALAATIKKRFYDTKTGLYAGDVDPRAPRWSRHAQFLAALSGIHGNASENAQLLKRALASSECLKPAAGFMKFYDLLALCENGLIAETLNLIRKEWGKIVAASIKTCPESIPEDCDDLLAFLSAERAETFDRFNGDSNASEPRFRTSWSFCHGWSAGPNHILSAHVAGLRPTSPGYESIVVQPFLGDLDWLHHEARTPAGVVEIHAKKAKTMKIDVKAPKGVKVETVH